MGCFGQCQVLSVSGVDCPVGSLLGVDVGALPDQSTTAIAHVHLGPRGFQIKVSVSLT